MIEIIYGTTNKSKLHSMQKIVEDFPIKLLPLPEGIDIVIDESGDTPLENARIKAKAYHEVLGKPVLSLDSGLYFEGVEEELQPRTRVRRQNGIHMNDSQMVKYYSDLAQQHGGKLVAKYQNAMCLVVDGQLIVEGQEPYMASEPFYIVSEPHSLVEEGFPLNRLSVEIESGEYYIDLRQTKYSSTTSGKSKTTQFFDEVMKKLKDR